MDNCPICGTTCELEVGFEETTGFEDEREIMYATCKTCKTRWRMRDDPKSIGKQIYEKWACRIPSINIQFPFVGGGTKLPSRWCRWVKVKEKQLPVEGLDEIKPEVFSRTKGKLYNETISLKAREYAFYDFRLSRGEKVTGETISNEPVDVYFLDEKNFERFERKKNFEEQDETEDVYEAKLEFEAPRKGKWFVVIDNQNKTSTKVKVQLESVPAAL